MYKKINSEITKKSKTLIEKTFYKELNYIHNDDIRNFATEMLRLAPGYFFSIPSSSSGKYHPAYENSKGGLVLHTRAVVYFMKEFFANPLFSFTDREQDLLITAALLHDFKKNGEKAHSEYTSFEHPRIAAKFILKFKDCGIIPSQEIEHIANIVETHMGPWNVNGKNSKFEPLPLPKTKEEKFLHMCDFLSSREDVNLSSYLFTEETVITTDELKTQVIKFGKYKGKTYGEVLKEDPGYLDWCYVQDMNKRNNKEKTFFSSETLEALKKLLYVENV